MKHDKKVVAGTLHFVLPISIGAVKIVDDVTEEEMKRALQTVFQTLIRCGKSRLAGLHQTAI